MASTRDEILARLRADKAGLQAEFPLKRLALFGSYARGTQIRGQSDVDSLVEVDPSIGLRFVTLPSGWNNFWVNGWTLSRGGRSSHPCGNESSRN